MNQLKTDEGLRIYIIICVAVLLMCAAFLVIRLSKYPVVVSGESMMPTYRDGQLLATHELGESEPKIGDVVVSYRHATSGTIRMIKRVVALPGDTVEIKNGILYRNGDPVAEDFPLMDEAGCAYIPITVPDHACFVLGDNRNNSSDSRIFSYVQYDDIFGIDDRKLFSLHLV